MTPETARAIGYVEGRTAERLATLKSAAKRGLDVLLIPERPLMFAGRCRLCGEPAKGAYCWTCDFMYGEATG